MKKDFIFPAKALEMIKALGGENRQAALFHAVRYGLGEAEPIEDYSEIERLIDRANSIERRAAKPTSEDYVYIVNHLNEKCGARYHVGSRKTKDLISARFGEGFTRDDFIEMIDFKCAEWKNSEKMRGYLRPETLFGAKFEGYLNQARMAKNNAGMGGAESSFSTDEFYSAALERSYGGVI